MASHQSSDIVRVAVAADLDTWSSSDWRDGVQIDQMAPLEHLLIRTRNNLYEFTILDPQNGEVIIRGGKFFAAPTRVLLSGATLGGSFLKLRGIYVGFSMELWWDGDIIITSTVQAIEVADSYGAAH